MRVCVFTVLVQFLFLLSFTPSYFVISQQCVSVHPLGIFFFFFGFKRISLKRDEKTLKKVWKTKEKKRSGRCENHGEHYSPWLHLWCDCLYPCFRKQHSLNLFGVRVQSLCLVSIENATFLSFVHISTQTHTAILFSKGWAQFILANIHMHFGLFVCLLITLPKRNMEENWMKKIARIN